MSDEMIEMQVPTRPAWVWVIFLYNLFSAGLTATMMWLTLSGKLPLDAKAKETLAQFTVLDMAETVLLLALTLAGTIQLFRMRRNAFALLSLTFGASLLSTAWHALQPNAVPFQLTGHLVGWAISIAICAYAWRLRSTGVLR